MLQQLLDVVLPVFLVIGAGWVLGLLKPVDLEPLTDVVIYLAAPALIFSALLGHPLPPGTVLQVGLGAVFITLAGGAVAWLWLRRVAHAERGMYLVMMFGNTGNLGLPLALFAFGDDGLAAGVVAFASVSVLHYTLGVFIVCGRSNVGEALRSPIVLATLTSFAIAAIGLEPPVMIMRGVGLLGQAAVPMMLLSLGLRLCTVRAKNLAIPVVAVVLRNLVGLGSALLWIELMGLTGATAGVVALVGVLPPAVMNFALAQKYAGRSDQVAAAIVVGTLVAMPVTAWVLSWTT